MSAHPLNDDIALRIGLASKELKDVETRQLLQLLIDIMGEPITAGKLEKLRAKKLREQGEGVFSSTGREAFEKAFALLKGRGIKGLLNSVPEYEEGVFCEIRGSLRVACASNRGENIDGKFSDCLRFLIYQVSPDYIRLIDIREPAMEKKRTERNRSRANLLKDCSVLYTTSIGALASAKVVKVGLHPVSLGDEQPAQQPLRRLQSVLAGESAPPWLIKAMGKPTLGVKLYGEQVR